MIRLTYYNTSKVVNPVSRKCHRGPMTSLERVLSKPFTLLNEFELLRHRLLAIIVNTDLIEVRTREVVLRVINSLLGPMFSKTYKDKTLYDAIICEKRSAKDIDTDLIPLQSFFLNSVSSFKRYKVTDQHLALIVSALKSNSPVYRVAGCCAIVMMAAFIEMEILNA